MQDEGGTEDWHIYAVAIASGETRDLTPLPGVQARIQELSLDEPDVVAIAINDRDKAWHDVYRIDIRTGERELLFENRSELAQHRARPPAARHGWPPRPRAKEGGHIVYRIDGGELEPIERRRARGRPHDLHRSASRATAARSTGISSIGRDKAALLATDWPTRQGARAGRAPQGRHRQRDRQPATRVVEAVGAAASDARLDPARRAHGRRPEAPARRAAGRGRASPTARSTITAGSSTASAAEAPATYYLYERGTGKHHRAVRHPARARGLSAGAHARRDHPRARRAGAGVLPDAAGGRAAAAQGAAADGAAGARRPVGARRLRLQPAAPVAGEPRLCRAVGQLPRLDRLRQGVRQRRRPASGAARCTTTCSTPSTGP